MTDEELKKRAENIWGLEALLEAPTPGEASVMVATLDPTVCWHQDLKFEPSDEEAYPGFIKQLARISRGLFRPSYVMESEGRITFHAHGYCFSHSAKPGHYLDAELLRTINSTIMGKARFQVVDNLGMPNVVLILSQSQKSALRVHNDWSFADSVAHPSGGELYGFLSTFWEQGMEEPAWLIFQDQRFCETPRKGWTRNGIHRLEAGAHLRLFERDASVIFEGVLGAKPKGLLGRLFKKPTLFPPEIAEETLKAWFDRAPCLRAHYRPA